MLFTRMNSFESFTQVFVTNANINLSCLFIYAARIERLLGRGPLQVETIYDEWSSKFLLLCSFVIVDYFYWVWI